MDDNKNGEVTEASLHLSSEERLKNLALLHVKRILMEDFINVSEFLKGKCEEEGDGLFAVQPNDKSPSTIVQERRDHTAGSLAKGLENDCRFHLCEFALRDYSGRAY